LDVSAGFLVKVYLILSSRVRQRFGTHWKNGGKKLEVNVNVPGSTTHPYLWVRHKQDLGMVLQPGWVEVGLRRSEMKRLIYRPGEMFLCRRHVEEWVRPGTLQYLWITISDSALNAAYSGTTTEVELRAETNLVNARIGALLAALNEERLAGFPGGQLFLDSIEQALAVALVSDYAVRHNPSRIYQGGLTPARLRRVTELVDAKIEDDLALREMAEAVGLSIAHFSQMFRKTTGQSPHQFVLCHRVQRAKEMLQKAESRVLDVAVACGFKTQQHFARVFRQICGASPTEYRQQLLR
jgi:AraC family transcriptional regulator